MLERLFVSLILVLVGTGGFVAFRHLHMRRADKAAKPVPTGAWRPTLLYFRSDHCAPCVTQTRYLEEVERNLGGLLAIREIDAEVEPEYAMRYHIFTLPTTLILDRGGRVTHINYGLTIANKLAQQLESVL